MTESRKISADFVITSPFTGLPLKETPDSISLENVVFQTKEELENFVAQHWENPIFCAEGFVKGG